MLLNKQIYPLKEAIPAVPPAQVQYVEPTNFQQYHQQFNVFLHKAQEYIKHNEGVKRRLYKDIKGNWTIGIGHLVTPEELQSFQDRPLTDDEINNLFQHDVDEKLKTIHRILGNIFDQFSMSQKIAVLDGFFRGDLSRSPKALEYLKQSKFAEAAYEYLNSNEYRTAKLAKSGVAGRMERNAALLQKTY